MTNGLIDPLLIGFIYAPLVVTPLLLIGIWWFRQWRAHPLTDGPGRLLSAAAQAMPAQRQEWGAAMLAELDQVPGMRARWGFALSGLRLMLFAPGRDWWEFARQLPICGALSVTLPPLALPFIYVSAFLGEALLKIGGSSAEEAMTFLVRLFLLITMGAMLAGVPLGIAGLWRRERARWLSITGPALSLAIASYFIIVMSLLAGKAD